MNALAGKRKPPLEKTESALGGRFVGQPAPGLSGIGPIFVGRPPFCGLSSPGYFRDSAARRASWRNIVWKHSVTADNGEITFTKTAMRRSAQGWLKSGFGLLAAGLLALSWGQGTIARAQDSKADLTPAFWQRDPAADFEDEGRMHCAPTAVSNGLIYLWRSNELKDLVEGDSHEDQIVLIQELAEAFRTDPSIGGTNPDRILTGLRSWLETKGYACDRLELKSWRGVSAANRKFKTGTKPDLEWMRSATESADTIVLLNFGWYHPADDDGDGYLRKGGHWVLAIGADSETEFQVRNPLLAPKRQREKTAVCLSPVDDDFPVTGGPKEGNLPGYYEGEGPGLPRGKTVRAILDAVIVFSLKR